jgi:hypothetical protein
MATGRNIFSALGAVFKGLHLSLSRKGVNVGGTADYPRVEIHSFTENAPSDKDGRMRSMSCIVESMSVKSYGDAVQMNEYNLAKLMADGWGEIGEGFSIIGITPDQLTELTETLETKEILYRQLQRINLLIWQN